MMLLKLFTVTSTHTCEPVPAVSWLAVNVTAFGGGGAVTIKIVSFTPEVLVHTFWLAALNASAEPLPAGHYVSSGKNPFDVDSDGRRNGASGPGLFQADLRLVYRLRPGAGRSLDLFVDVFNVTNRANFENPTGDRRSTDFLNLTALRAGAVPTTAQIGVRMQF